MADSTILGLSSQDLGEIYEAENPLAELLRKIVMIETRNAEDEAPSVFEDWEAFG